MRKTTPGDLSYLLLRSTSHHGVLAVVIKVCCFASLELLPRDLVVCRFSSSAGLAGWLVDSDCGSVGDVGTPWRSVGRANNNKSEVTVLQRSDFVVTVQEVHDEPSLRQTQPKRDTRGVVVVFLLLLSYSRAFYA